MAGDQGSSGKLLSVCKLLSVLPANGFARMDAQFRALALTCVIASLGFAAGIGCRVQDLAKVPGLEALRESSPNDDPATQIRSSNAESDQAAKSADNDSR